jgi:hypothetical protein
MSDEIQPFGASGGGELPPQIHVRTFVLQPRGPIGKLLFAAVLIGAGVLFFTVGIALALSLAAVAAVTGLGVIAYRAITGKRSAPLGPPPDDRSLDPSKQVFLRRPE